MAAVQSAQSRVTHGHHQFDPWHSGAGCYSGALDGGPPMSPVNFKKWQCLLSLIFGAVFPYNDLTT